MDTRADKNHILAWVAPLAFISSGFVALLFAYFVLSPRLELLIENSEIDTGIPVIRIFQFILGALRFLVDHFWIAIPIVIGGLLGAKYLAPDWPNSPGIMISILAFAITALALLFLAVIGTCFGLLLPADFLTQQGLVLRPA